MRPSSALGSQCLVAALRKGSFAAGMAQQSLPVSGSDTRHGVRGWRPHKPCCKCADGLMDSSGTQNTPQPFGSR